MATHPANLAGGHAGYECVWFDVAVDYRSCCHEGVLTNGYTADDGAVGAKGRAPLDGGDPILVFAQDSGARVVNIGKHHARAAEDIVFQPDGIVDRDIVLHLDIVADYDIVADEDVLPE